MAVTASIKVPPNSIDAEKSVLGACLLDRDAVVEVVEFLRPEHFYEDKHGKIFGAIMDLYQEREPVDVVAVGERLKKAKSLTEVGGQGYLAELVNGVPTAAHAAHYGGLVKDILSKSFDRLDELHKAAGSLRGVPTGFSELDDTLAGMQESNLLILAARPGVGEKALALNIAQNTAL